MSFNSDGSTVAGLQSLGARSSVLDGFLSPSFSRVESRSLGVGSGPCRWLRGHTISGSHFGYETFQTDINPLPRQKVEVKTDLVKSEVPASTGVAVAVASEAAACAPFRHGY